MILHFPAFTRKSQLALGLNYCSCVAFFVINDALLIKIILLKYIQRDDAYGQCELYDAHLWQVNNHHIFSLTFAYTGGNVPLPSSAAWLEKLTDLFRLTI